MAGLHFFEKYFKKMLAMSFESAYLCRAFLKAHFDLVAQSVEHLTFNQGVMGSSPIEITTKFSPC